MAREEPPAVRLPVASGNCLCPSCTYGLQRPKEVRAEKLLLEVLGPEDYVKLHSASGLRIPSRLLPGMSYCIQAVGRCMLADKDGNLFGHLCLVPVGDVPLGDHVLALVLLARNHEERLLTGGNIFGPPTELLIQVRQLRERLPGAARPISSRPLSVTLRLIAGSLAQWFHRLGERLRELD